MKKVANRRAIRTLSYRTMGEKKWKNMIAVLAIALTSLLFTALFTVGSSMVESIQEGIFRQIGTCAHGGYKYLTWEEYERIKAAGGYKDISFDIIAGFGANPELNKIQTEIRYAEDAMAKWSYSYPQQGRMPNEINEIAASSKVLEALGVPLEIGAKVPLSISTHDREGKEKILNEEFVLSGFWYSNDASHAQEVWIAEEYLDTHIDLLEQNYNEREREKGLYSAEGSIQASIWFDSSYDIESKMEELTVRAGFSEDEVRISVNWGYAASSVDAMTLALGIGILAVIILSGYLIIYNIFYINVSTDIRYYGLLKTIGTTGRQLRRMVRIQAFMLSVMGIPLGLLSGWFVGKMVLPYMNQALNGVKGEVSLNPWIFAGSAAFSLLVVWLSCIRPCRLASKVSPIEAVRYVENGQYKKKEKKSGKVTAWSLAAANMGRNKRKAAVVIASLSLCLILLNGTYCLVKGFSFDKYVKDYLLEDLQVSHFSSVNMTAQGDFEAVPEELMEEISKIPGVESVKTLRYKGGTLRITEEAMERFRAYYGSEDKKDNVVFQSIVQEMEESGITHGNSYCLQDELLSVIEVTEGVYDPEKFRQGGYALLAGDRDSVHWIHPGDKITLGNYEIDGEQDSIQPPRELEVMAVVKLPYAAGTKFLTLGGAAFILSQEDFEGLYESRGYLHGCISVEPEKEKEIIAAVSEMLSENYPDLVLITKDSLRKEFAAETRMFSVIGGLLSFILGLIGVLNLVNAMITSILSRKQEFAMMQAVGMTGKQLEQMLAMEGIWYGLWTLLISATLGNVVSYGMIYLMGKNMNYFMWSFHILPLAVSVPVIAVLSLALPVICYHTLCKKSIIERLRLAEV